MLLVKRAKAFHVGDEAAFTPDGRLYEADELARSFNQLARTAKAQQKDLALKERRQAAFVSDVAHELRTPLTAIRGNAEMLLDPDLPPEMHEKFLSIIIGESERLSRLTNDLLTLKRIENDIMPFELSRVNLTKVCNVAHLGQVHARKLEGRDVVLDALERQEVVRQAAQAARFRR